MGGMTRTRCIDRIVGGSVPPVPYPFRNRPISDDHGGVSEIDRAVAWGRNIGEHRFGKRIHFYLFINAIHTVIGIVCLHLHRECARPRESMTCVILVGSISRTRITKIPGDRIQRVAFCKVHRVELGRESEADGIVAESEIETGFHVNRRINGILASIGVGYNKRDKVIGVGGREHPEGIGHGRCPIRAEGPQPVGYGGPCSRRDILEIDPALRAEITRIIEIRHRPGPRNHGNCD